MINFYKNFLTFTGLTILSLNSMAQTSTNPDSSNTNWGPLKNGASMLLCPQEVIAPSSDGGGATLTHTLTNVPLVFDVSCKSMGSAGSVGWGDTFILIGTVFGMGGSFNPSCPANYPYLGGTSEKWVGVFAASGGGGGAKMTYTCCSILEEGYVSLKVGYDSGNYDTWQSTLQGPNGPYCP